MSVLIIGGDKINKISELLKSFGATSTTHWDSRRRSTSHKKIPLNTDVVIMLTDFLSHNSMYQFKRDAKEQNIPLLCTRRGNASIVSEFTKFLEGAK